VDSRVVVDGVAYTYAGGATLEAGTRRLDDLFASLALVLPAGSHTISLEWRSYGFDWTTINDGGLSHGERLLTFISSENSQPQIASPTILEGLEDSPLVMRGVSIADDDSLMTLSGGLTLDVTITVSVGYLSFPNTPLLANPLEYSHGVYESVVRIHDTLLNINSILLDFIYLPPTNWFGKDYVAILVTDNSNVGFGSGSTVSRSNTSVVIESVDDPFSSNIPFSERQALFDLYHFTQGTKWIWNDNSLRPRWDFNDPTINPCDSINSWQGLTCIINSGVDSMIFNVIVGINLKGYNLHGPLSESIGDMIHLQELVLSNNRMTGTLPISIYNLSSLIVLLIDDNQFNGTLSNSIDQLSQLLKLELRQNNFFGTIPSSIAALTHLKTLAMSYNSFSGTLPNNAVLTNLILLNVAVNHLIGTIPCGLSNASSLMYLILPNNEFTGTIPQCWKSATKLQALFISHNHMIGSMPSFITEWSEMKFFGFFGNIFTGTLPFLGNMRSLETIYAYDNFFTGTIPDMFSQMPLISELRLQNNLFKGVLPQSLSTLQNNVIKEMIFFIQSNLLSGSLNNLFKSKKLQLLQVSDNYFSGTLPEDLFSLQSLQIFSAVSNCIHGSLPNMICNAISLTVLALDGLMRSTSCYSKQSIQQSLYIRNRFIVGGIPACIYNMSSLTTLHLSGNGITGSLPDTNFGGMLSDLSLTHNLLHGNILASI